MKMLFGAIVCLMVSSCGSDIPILGVCEDYAAAGLNVIPTDSVTGARITDPNLAVIATDGTFSDTVTLAAAGPGTSIPLAWERAGTYEVEVIASGFKAWIRVIEVEEDRCHVKPVVVNARLQLE